VTLTYSAPSNNGGSSITGYYIYIGTSAGGVSSTPLNTTPINSTRVTVTGTTKGVTYYFIVRAANKNGTGAPSNELSATSQ
jgi:titin